MQNEELFEKYMKMVECENNLTDQNVNIFNSDTSVVKDDTVDSAQKTSNHLTFSQIFAASKQKQEHRLLDPLAHNIKKWALLHRVTHDAVTDLLGILDEHAEIKSLPKDSRTLLRTPTFVEIQKLGSGEFW